MAERLVRLGSAKSSLTGEGDSDFARGLPFMSLGVSERACELPSEPWPGFKVSAEVAVAVAEVGSGLVKPAMYSFGLSSSNGAGEGLSILVISSTDEGEFECLRDTSLDLAECPDRDLLGLLRLADGE